MEILEEKNREININIDSKVKVKKNSKRLRDIKRILNNEKIKLTDEKKIELQNEMKEIEYLISKNKSSRKRKLNRYLEFKKNKQKTMRFVELVKVKRKINQLQKKLVFLLENQRSTTEISEIKLEIKVYKTYEDYIRLSPFFKDRKYIPLFSNKELDPITIENRNKFINDIQELKDKLRIEKCRISSKNEFDSNESFLLSEDNKDQRKFEKIEYNIDKRSTRDKFKEPKKPNDNKKKVNNIKKKENIDKEEKVEKTNQNHIIFSDSD